MLYPSVGPKLFWTDQKCFGLDQKSLRMDQKANFSSKENNPNYFGIDQIIFGPIEGQGAYKSSEKIGIIVSCIPFPCFYLSHTRTEILNVVQILFFFHWSTHANINLRFVYFLPHFWRPKSFLRVFFRKFLTLCTVSIQERAIMAHVWYIKLQIKATHYLQLIY